MTLFESEDSFLSLWFKGCEGSIEGRAIRGNEVSREFFPVDEPRKAVEWAVQYQGWNVFYGICPRKDDSSGRESNLRDLPGLAVDLDFKDFEGGETEVWALIDGFKYPASLLVHSGGGFHAYWKFRDPVPPTQKLKAQLKGLCRALRGDQAATDLSRLLRLPGTWNYKYNPPIPVRVLRITDVTYTPYDFAEFEVELAPDGRPVELTELRYPRACRNDSRCCSRMIRVYGLCGNKIQTSDFGRAGRPHPNMLQPLWWGQGVTVSRTPNARRSCELSMLVRG